MAVTLTATAAPRPPKTAARQCARQPRPHPSRQPSLANLFLISARAKKKPDQHHSLRSFRASASARFARSFEQTRSGLDPAGLIHAAEQGDASVFSSALSHLLGVCVYFEIWFKDDTHAGAALEAYREFNWHGPTRAATQHCQTPSCKVWLSLRLL